MNYQNISGLICRRRLRSEMFEAKEELLQDPSEAMVSQVSLAPMVFIDDASNSMPAV